MTILAQMFPPATTSYSNSQEKMTTLVKMFPPATTSYSHSQEKMTTLAQLFLPATIHQLPLKPQPGRDDHPGLDVPTPLQESDPVSPATATVDQLLMRDLVDREENMQDICLYGQALLH